MNIEILSKWVHLPLFLLDIIGYNSNFIIFFYQFSSLLEMLVTLYVYIAGW